MSARAFLAAAAAAALFPSSWCNAATEQQTLAAHTARRIAELFLSTDPTLYKPQGYSGYKAYGGSQIIHYATASLWANALECAHIMGDASLENRLAAPFAQYYSRKDVLNEWRHVDLSIVGAIPLEIAILSADSQARETGLHYANRQWEEPSAADKIPVHWYGDVPLSERLDWWRKGYSPETRLWIDDMYMITFLQSQAFRLTGDTNYICRAGREMTMYLARLQRADGLFNHAPGAPFAWGRGNGWMAAAMAINLKYLPANDPSREPILAGYRAMMATLLHHQRESGLWGQIVDDAASWDETSASAMFAYALCEGAKNSYLPDPSAAQRAVDKAFAALVAKMDEFGNLADVCAGTGWKNDRTHYMRRPRVNGDPHGQAPMLWLCSSLLQ